MGESSLRELGGKGIEKSKRRLNESRKIKVPKQLM